MKRMIKYIFNVLIILLSTSLIYAQSDTAPLIAFNSNGKILWLQKKFDRSWGMTSIDNKYVYLQVRNGFYLTIFENGGVIGKKAWPESDVYYYISSARDNILYLCGWQIGKNDESVGLLVKYDMKEDKYTTIANDFTVWSTCESLAISNEGAVFISINVTDKNYPDLPELSSAYKYSDGGKLQWEHEYAVSQLIYEVGLGRKIYIYTDNTGHAYYAGSDPNGETDEYRRHAGIVKFSDIGKVIWRWESEEYCSEHILTGNSKEKTLYLMAECGNYSEPSLFVVDMETGKTIRKWKTNFQDISETDAEVVALSTYPTGGVFLIQHVDHELYDIFSAFDVDGKLRWEREFHYPEWTEDGGAIYDLAIDRYGNAYANISACRDGYDWGDPCYNNTWGMVKISPDGDIEWSRLLTGNEPSEASIDDTDEYIIVGYPYGIALGPDLAVEETDDDTPMLSGDDDADEGCGC